MRSEPTDPGDVLRGLHVPSSRVSADDIVRSLTDALVVVDREWRIVYVNPAAERLHRTPSATLLKRTLWQQWPDLLGTPAEREYRHAMDSREPARFEQSGASATEQYLDTVASPCSDGLLIQHRDVTERKRLEEELQTREEELTDFVENAGVGLHWVGPDGTIVWANNAELNLLGYTREEYFGRDVREIHHDQSVITDILDRLSRGEDIHDCEAQLRCKDGSLRRVLITSNVYRKNGEFKHSRCFTRDISDRALAHDVQQRLAAIVESSDDAIISKNLQGIILSWNRGAERIFGYTADEVIGKPVSILAVPERVDEIPNILERITRGEPVEHYITQRRSKDGRALWVSLSVSPIRDHSGTIIGASKVARDVTASEQDQENLREMNEQLQRANTDLQQFAYSAAHDLQEPLRMVSLFTQLLQRQYGGKLGSDADVYLKHTVDSAQRMNRLLHDLLTYNEISAAAIPEGQVADPNAALRIALTNLEAAITESGAVVTCDELPLVSMRPIDLEQLFQNLIGNAIKYRSQEPPRISIGARRRGTEWLFSVKDNGIGINPQYGEQIFGLFKRLHAANEYPGTGLGLAICQRIIERAGGRLWVESEPGNGATFSFTLPVHKP